MRPSWDEYFIEIAKLASKRSTCLRRKVGAVLIKNNQIISTGYNGAPKRTRHCTEIGHCIRERLNIPSGQQEICKAAHAEANAIAQATANDVSTEGATLYCTHFPCAFCSKIIINAGVKKLIYMEGYGSDENLKLSEELLKEAGIELKRFGVG